MADGRGGYQRPSRPAPASGPGAQSRRTDGGPADRQAMRDIPNARYGEQAAYQAAQGAAPMAGGGGGRAGVPSPTPAPAPPPPPGLMDETTRPDEAITAGADAGAGPSAAEAGIEMDMDVQDMEHMREIIHGLEYIANFPTSTPSTRAFVRAIKSRL